MRHEERAFFRSRLTANTAREGRPSDEQADVLDDILDDIESALETNAEEYVNSFVQKGGE